VFAVDDYMVKKKRNVKYICPRRLVRTELMTYKPRLSTLDDLEGNFLLDLSDY
jgi:hypothetical protein